MVSKHLKQAAVDMCLHLGVGAGGVSYTAAGKAVGVHRKFVARGHKNYLKYGSIEAKRGPIDGTPSRMSSGSSSC